ncbi:AAC(3)-I family aminoglycoside N-acetyltransferase [Phenylobacterium sp.]|jgi:aminoglycoside 3-N-acetyltransferase I|uniref:AAC(3)-I family aminoglycoside N-acetyltransferase n=1 Tax=Phenylobacterium sp. TaxID=1871053 RepID=UPI002F3F7971
MKTPLLVTRLGPGDLDRLRALNRLFAAAFEDPESYAAAPPSDAYLAALLARDHTHVLVALVGETVIGGLTAYELEKFEQARREVYIYDLAVDEAHRRQGVATALIGELQVVTRSRGAYVIFVQADHGDEPAIALYESLGEREEVLHFDIPV